MELLYFSHHVKMYGLGTGIPFAKYSPKCTQLDLLVDTLSLSALLVIPLYNNGIIIIILIIIISYGYF